MRVGYLGDIKISRKTLDDSLLRLTEESAREKLNYLILCGGISEDFNTTLVFVNSLRDSLYNHKIKLRFIPGNTDFYYNVPVVNKQDNFMTIRNLFLSNQSCLISNPIITSNVRIIGTESWYDYSLYRGSPVSLKSITKKSKLFGLIKNNDVKYITDENDYMLGVKNTFDYQYSKKCKDWLISSLKEYERKYMKPLHSVVVGYFYPIQSFLSKGIYSGYFGTFKGSDLSDVLNQFYVTEYVVGLTSDMNDFSFNNIRFTNAKNKMVVRDYVK